MSTRVITANELGELCKRWRQDNRRVVLCSGEFDLIHPGHIERLESAKREGDVLVVAVVPDSECSEPPTLNQDLRAQVLGELGLIDAVAILSGGAVSALNAVRPDVFVPVIDSYGPHHMISTDLMTSAENEVGTRIHVLPDTAFRRRTIDDRPDPVKLNSEAFLRDFRGRWSATSIIEMLASLKELKILVVGDTILDEYHYCRPYGMPLKSPIIAAQSMGSEMYAGGILAVANHIANFCERVDLVTVLGTEPSHETFIQRHLGGNIIPTFFSRDGAPTMVKSRFVQSFLLRKLFEISYFDDRPLPAKLSSEINDWLQARVGEYDAVVVADFGHGMMTSELIDTVSTRSRFLALNTQLNSVNFGYHVVGKYPRADYICIDENEMRLAARDRLSPLGDLIGAAACAMDARYFTVTRGHHGSLTWERGGHQVSVPVLSPEVVDTIGAGDAYLSVTAACVAAGLPTEVVAFIGNCVGALAVRIVGNQHAVQQSALIDFIRGVLK